MMQRKTNILLPCGAHQVSQTMYENEALDQREEEKWFKQCSKLIKKLESCSASITFLSENNVAQNNEFNESVTLLKTELKIE